MPKSYTELSPADVAFLREHNIQPFRPERLMRLNASKPSETARRLSAAMSHYEIGFSPERAWESLQAVIAQRDEAMDEAALWSNIAWFVFIVCASTLIVVLFTRGL